MVGALAGLAVVDAAGLQACRVEGLDSRAVLGLEGEMVAAGQLAGRRLAVEARDEKLVDPEIVLLLSTDRYAENVENSLVEAAARLDVADHKLDVVDQPAAVE